MNTSDLQPKTQVPVGKVHKEGKLENLFIQLLPEDPQSLQIEILQFLDQKNGWKK